MYKQAIGRYKVISGIMEGLEFNGHPICINGENRIFNCETIGQSYPLINIKTMGPIDENGKVNPFEITSYKTLTGKGE